jgi:hypothetical protein
MKELPFKYPRLVKILADQGFDGEGFINNILHTFGWVVERTFGWLGFQRRSVKHYEVLTQN